MGIGGGGGFRGEDESEVDIKISPLNWQEIEKVVRARRALQNCRSRDDWSLWVITVFLNKSASQENCRLMANQY